MTVRLKPLDERKISATDVINRLRATAPQVAGGNLYPFGAQDIDPPRMSDGSSYDLSLMASDLAVLRSWMPKINEALRELPELTDLDTPSEGGTQQVMLKIDREAARRLGVDMQTVAQLLNNSFSQRQIATLYDRLNQYRVVMELEPQYAADPVVLDQVQVVTATGASVPPRRSPGTNIRWCRTGCVTAADVAAENVGFGLAEDVSIEQALTAIDGAMARIMLPTDIQVRLSGSRRTSRRPYSPSRSSSSGCSSRLSLVLGMLYESLIHP
jgi:multidrug efflux pump